VTSAPPKAQAAQEERLTPFPAAVGKPFIPQNETIRLVVKAGAYSPELSPQAARLLAANAEPEGKGAPSIVHRRARKTVTRFENKPRSPRVGVNKGDPGEDFSKPLRFGERMLRNTAVAVAVLLCVLAVQRLDVPIAQTVSAQLHDWVTMDLDESLGSLKFVQNLLPDAALVFWHIGSTESFAQPAESALSHGWADEEPWLVFASDAPQPVYASAAGEVMGVSYLDESTVSVRVRHPSGLETVYGNLSACKVREGDTVQQGEDIGESTALFFEIRSDGRSMNPAPLMAKAAGAE